jgi:hypothetical protein
VHHWSTRPGGIQAGRQAPAPTLIARRKTTSPTTTALSPLPSRKVEKKNKKFFQDYLSHQILRHVHKVLNTDENKN